MMEATRLRGTTMQLVIGIASRAAGESNGDTHASTSLAPGQTAVGDECVLGVVEAVDDVKARIGALLQTHFDQTHALRAMAPDSQNLYVEDVLRQATALVPEDHPEVSLALALWLGDTIILGRAGMGQAQIHRLNGNVIRLASSDLEPAVERAPVHAGDLLVLSGGMANGAVNDSAINEAKEATGSPQGMAARLVQPPDKSAHEATVLVVSFQPIGGTPDAVYDGATRPNNLLLAGAGAAVLALIVAALAWLYFSHDSHSAVSRSPTVTPIAVSVSGSPAPTLLPASPGTTSIRPLAARSPYLDQLTPVITLVQGAGSQVASASTQAANQRFSSARTSVKTALINLQNANDQLDTLHPPHSFAALHSQTRQVVQLLIGASQSIVSALSDINLGHRAAAGKMLQQAAAQAQQAETLLPRLAQSVQGGR